MQQLVKDVFNLGNLTKTAGTVIDQVVPAKNRLKAVVTSMSYLCGTTAHTLTVMKVMSKTRLLANAAASQAVITVAVDLGLAAPRNTVLAANDYVAVQCKDGSTFLSTVASVSGSAPSFSITLNNNLTVAANGPGAVNPGGQSNPAGNIEGGWVWFFGVVADQTATAQLMTVSVANTLSDSTGGVASASSYEEPLFIHSNNATAAGTLSYVNGVYLGIPGIGGM